MKTVERRRGWPLLVVLAAAIVFLLVVGLRRPEPTGRPVAAIAERSDEAPALNQRSYDPTVAGDPLPTAATAPTSAAGTAADPAIDPSRLPNLNVKPEEAARIEADRVLQELQGSGGASSELTASAVRLVDDWKRLPMFAGVELRDLQCFGTGCSFTSVHRDMASAASVGEAMVRESSFFTWPGGRFRSGYIPRPSGQVEMVWVLFARTPPPAIATKETP